MKNKKKEANIITTGNLNHIQRANKLKGVVQEKLIGMTMDLSKKDTSLRKYATELGKEVPKHYLVKKNFISKKGAIFERGDIILENEFINDDNKCVIYDNILEKEPENKFCNTCAISTSVKNKFKKCIRCNSGYYRKHHSNNIIKKLILEGNIDYLKEKTLLKNKTSAQKSFTKYLKQLSFERKRLDFLHKKDNKLIVYESKNKENTNLSYFDVLSTLVYPIVLRRLDMVVNDILMIYNSGLSDEDEKLMNNKINEIHKIDVQFMDAKEYLFDHNIFIKDVIITPKKYDEDKIYSYNYEFIYRDCEFEGPIIIDIKIPYDIDPLKPTDMVEFAKQQEERTASITTKTITQQVEQAEGLSK